MFATNQSQTVSGITYNGTALTQLDAYGPGGNNKQSTWYLINPSTGANDIVATFSSSLAYYDFAAISCTGVKQTSPFGTPVKAFSNSNVSDQDSAQLTTTVANSWAVDSYSFGSDGGTITADSGQTLRASNRQGMTGQIYTKLMSSAGNTQMDTTVTNANNFSHVTWEMFEVVASGNIKKLNNLNWANVKKVNGIAVANLKKINGITA
jgi:hypothetical protein